MNFNGGANHSLCQFIDSHEETIVTENTVYRRGAETQSYIKLALMGREAGPTGLAHTK